MDEEKTGDELRDREAKDSSTRSETGSPGAYGPPEVGERGDPQRDPESGVPREEAQSEPGDIEPDDDPSMGKETRGG
jgi:hypothetical protein